MNREGVAVVDRVGGLVLKGKGATDDDEDGEELEELDGEAGVLGKVMIGASADVCVLLDGELDVSTSSSIGIR